MPRVFSKNDLPEGREKNERTCPAWNARMHNSSLWQPCLGLRFKFAEPENQDDGKGGFEFKGGSLHDGFGGFDGFGGSGEHPTLIFLSYKIQHNDATAAVLTVSAVLAVMAVSVVTATPLNLNPPLFRHPEKSWAWLPKLCRTSGVPQNLSSTGL